ncbi:MAG: hypothetical protein GXY19_01805 [Phycisphaerae bacterium]|nr:hypothetical protein [Phycisphaerae bacterium]
MSLHDDAKTQSGRHPQWGRRQFRRRRYFFTKYAEAHTPNPYVMCNRLVRFGRLWGFVQEAGAEFLATGHYARVLQRNGLTAEPRTPDHLPGTDDRSLPPNPR